MAENIVSKTPLEKGAPIPSLRSIPKGDREERGAPVPNMQPIPSNRPQSGNGQAHTSNVQPKKGTTPKQG